jgi:DNA-binding transcriptional ArsR family regulator
MEAMMSNAFDAVAEPARRGILDLLVDGGRPVGEIATATGLSQPNASRHLRILREAGVVAVRPEGQRRIYELRPAGLVELFGWIAPYQRLWHASLDALERHLDEKE